MHGAILESKKGRKEGRKEGRKKERKKERQTERKKFMYVYVHSSFCPLKIHQ